MEGGIANFMVRNERKRKKVRSIDKLYNADYYKIKNKYANEFNRYKFTQRVILPEKNPEVKNFQKIKTLAVQEKNLRHATDGTYKSLMIKTPITFPIKGRKRMNKSFDCGNKPDCPLFFDDKIEECAKDNDKLFGVQRKHRTKIINLESEIPPYKFGRKPFFEKCTKSQLFDL